MILNHVGLFYTFLLRFHSEGSEERGAPGHCQALYRGGQPGRGDVHMRPGRRDSRPWPAHKGRRSLVARLQGQHPRPARRGATPTEAPRVGTTLARPRAAALAARPAANGAQHYRQHKGGGDRRKEVARARVSIF
ncbi:hypothetical protein GW17_00049445 [Ensete ventricosum]|nr:hypothetical protein GW17_00049445 [Ensete ventricosum]